MSIFYSRSERMKRTTIIATLFVSLIFSVNLKAKTVLILGVHPYKSVVKLQKLYLPLAGLLSKKLNQKVILNIAKDYETHIKLIGSDAIDIAYMGPASYVSMVKRYGKKRILARQVIKGKPTFKGAIIVRNDGKIKKYSDLKGKSFAFGDPASTMSHLVPRYMLIKNGIDKNNLGEISFLGSHDNVAFSVLTGEYDAGAVKEEVFYKYKNKGLTTLAFTPELSEHLFVTSNKLSKKLVNKIQKVFLELNNHKEGLAVMKGIKKSMTGMATAKEKDYNNLREILGLLKKKEIIK